jgi:hypothetical protein
MAVLTRRTAAAAPPSDVSDDPDDPPSDVACDPAAAPDDPGVFYEEVRFRVESNRINHTSTCTVLASTRVCTRVLE